MTKHITARRNLFPICVVAVLAPPLLAAAASRAAQPKGNAKRPAAAEPSGSWNLAGEPRAFEDLCFEDRGSLGGLSEREARELLEGVKNQKLNVSQQSHGNTRIVRLQGLAKLRGWAADAALRVSFANLGPQTRIHVWGGSQGVTLYYYTWPRPMWYAYRTLRKPGEPRPERRPGDPPALVLLAHDDGRNARLSGDTYQLRCQEGAVVLTKGDMRLLTAPLAEAATAVYLEARQGATLRELAVGRGGPAPAENLRPHRLLQDGSPDTLPWKETLPSGARFQRVGGSGVELSAGKTNAVATALTPLPRAGLVEVIARLENVTPGTGLFFADEKGQAHAAAEFSREVQSSAVALVAGKPGNMPWPPTWQVDNGPAVFTDQRPWLRMVGAAGVLKVWTSADGLHWGQAFDPQPLNGACSQVGLYVQARGDSGPPGIPEERSIRVRVLQVRQLDGLTELAAEGLLRQAAAVGPRRAETDKDLGAWQERVGASLPPGGDAAAWRYACALHALAANPSADFAKPLLDAVVRDGLARAPSFIARLRLLQDAAMAWDAWNEQDARRYAGHWEQLGRSLLADGAAADFDLFRHYFLTASLWTQNTPNPRIEPVSARLARDRLLVLWGQQRWQELHALLGELRFWRQSLEPGGTWPQDQESLRQMVAWMVAETGGKAAAPAAARRPLVPLLNRDAYNLVSDLQAAADDKHYEDAAHALATAALPSGPGLVPDIHDAQHLTSFPTAVKLLVRRHAPLQQVMQERYKGADQLRVAQSIAQGNRAVIEGISLQYHGTPAAADADLWLGDRLMSAGEFAGAAARYKQALALIAPERQPQVAARLRLAAAMLGRAVGEPPRQPVVFGDQQVPPERFERWVAEMIERNRGGGELPRLPGPVQSSIAGEPVALEAKSWAKFEGDVGQAANEVPPQAQGIDWPARQLAAMAVGDVLLAANRFQIAAFELATGKQRWTFSLGGAQGRTHGWSLVPMRPLAAGRHVYARLLPQTGKPEIACIEIASGKKLWQGDGNLGEIVSDPLLVQGRLFVLASDLPSGQIASQLYLVELAADTGEVLARRFLFDVRGSWAAQQGCQACVADDRIVAALAGALFCLDAEGQVVWVRFSPALPREADPAAGQQVSQPPLFSGDRLYASQPGTRSVECVELESGRLLWRRALAGIVRLLACSPDSAPSDRWRAGVGAAAREGRVLVETVDGLVALDARNGQILWEREIPRLLDGYAMVADKFLLCAHRKPVGGGQWCPMLAWVDAAGGRVLGESPLWELSGKQGLLGPLVAEEKNLWCFSDVTDAQGTLQPQRNIARLARAASAAPVRRASGGLWDQTIDAGPREAAGLILPGWTVLSAEREDSQGLRRQWNKADNVLALRGHLETPRLARWLSVPAGARPRLFMEFGCEPNQELHLEVRAGDRPLHSLKVNEKAETWKTVEVDLSSCAGRAELITVVLRSSGFTWTYWKRLEIQGLPTDQ